MVFRRFRGRRRRFLRRRLSLKSRFRRFRRISRKKSRRRKRERKNEQPVVRPFRPWVFPDRAFAKLKFHRVSRVPVGYDGPGDLYYVGKWWHRGSAPVDCGNGGGQNAQYFALFTQFYQKYVCHGSKIKIRVRAESDMSPVGVVVFPDIAISDYVGVGFPDGMWQKLKNYPRARFVEFQHMDPGRRALRQYCATKTVYGLHSIKESYDYHADTVNPTGPVRQFQWHTYAYLLREDGPVPGFFEIQVEFEITYYVEFYLRKVYNTIGFAAGEDIIGDEGRVMTPDTEILRKEQEEAEAGGESEDMVVV